MKYLQRAITLAVAACFLAIGGSAAQAGPRIVNGLNTQNFPSTGALLYSGGAAINANNASSWCSGTLIGCSTFLTAAHCINEDLNPSHYQVYLQHGGLYTVSSVTYHPNYNTALSGRDVAIVKLAAPVTGIDPMPVNSTHDLNALGVGLDGTIAGFGRTGGGSDYGVKRYGKIVTANCNGAQTAGEGNDVLVCWNYDPSVGPAGEDSNTCNGDSGGPLFMDFAGTTEVVGVTSAGVTTNCLPTDHSWDASVYYNASWIAGQLGADSTSTCGALAPVGDGSVMVHANSGSLSAGNPSESFNVNLVGAATLLRFTLNGTDNGSFNPDFFVKQGSGASASLFDCKADGTGVFGACEFTNPDAGPWSVLVQHEGGSGEYQVTTTVFGGDAPVCGNDMAEFGEECDGNDLGICTTGPCQACSCPPSVCGNGVVESGETCDGASDSACPGQCDGSCMCQESCTRGDLYGLSISADTKRLSYQAQLFDETSAYLDLDPRDAPFTMEIVDGLGVVEIAIPAADAGWIKADPIKRKYRWKGDGSLAGLQQVKLQYKVKSSGTYWQLHIRGKEVPGADGIDVNNVLDFRLGFDGTCHRETW